MSSELLKDLALANQILVNEGVLDGFGHISVRNPANPQRFFIARSMAPALVEPEDLLEVDLEGQVHDPQGRRTYVERFIHSAIYKARPDVMSVIHSHSPAVIPFGVTGARLRPICHMSGFLGATTPVYEIRAHAGEIAGVAAVVAADHDHRVQAAGVQHLEHRVLPFLRGRANGVEGAEVRLEVRLAVGLGNLRSVVDGTRPCARR